MKKPRVSVLRTNTYLRVAKIPKSNVSKIGSKGKARTANPELTVSHNTTN